MPKTACVLAVTLATVAIQLATTSVGQASESRVTAIEFGDDWPLTVDEAELDCLHDGSQLITIRNQVFALNGKAKGKGFRSPDEHLKPHPMFSDVKADVGPLILRARELCD